MSFIPVFSVPEDNPANIQVSLAVSDLRFEGRSDLTFEAGKYGEYNISPLVSGGNPPYKFGLVGGRGENLADFSLRILERGVVAGTPAKTGSFKFTALVDDSSQPRQFKQAEFSGKVVDAGSGARTGPKYTGKGVDLTIEGLERMLNNFVCWINRVAFLLIIIFIIWTGIKYFWASGNPTEATAVHQAFKYVIIGAAVILGVGFIIATISALLGVDVSGLTLRC